MLNSLKAAKVQRRRYVILLC